MPFSKEKAKRAEFVIREVKNLLQEINPDVKGAGLEDRGDYEEAFVEYSDGSIIEFDVTGTTLAELATAFIERIECYE
ncbi:MAG: hypothetical protein IJ435_03605 [Clostridia bacterium]|nr:hypothetical protein [Clostridia bacterium]